LLAVVDHFVEPYVSRSAFHGHFRDDVVKKVQRIKLVERLKTDHLPKRTRNLLN